jgi:hypothetical protein
MRTLVCAVLLAALSPAAAADTISLTGGGKVRGSVDAVVFLQEGKKKTFQRGEFVGLCLNETGLDIIQLNADKTEKGELVCVRVKSIGGVLTFPRARIAVVTIAKSDTDKLRAEYLRRRAAIRKDDAQAMYDLAAWCKEHSLAAEANDLAERCLAAEPGDELAVLAHRMLGHVFRDGRWVQPARLKAEENEEKPDKDKTSEPVRESAPEEIDPASAQTFRELAEEYAEKVKIADERDEAAVRDAYEERWNSVIAESKKLRKTLEQKNDRRVRLRDNIRSEKRKGEGGYPDNPKTYDEGKRKERIDELRRQYDRVRDEVRRLEKAYKKSRKEILHVGLKIKASKSAAHKRGVQRRNNFNVARSKIQRLLRLKKRLSEAEMRAIFETVLE